MIIAHLDTDAPFQESVPERSPLRAFPLEEDLVWVVSHNPPESFEGYNDYQAEA